MVLVIGIGNALRGDDSAGLEVATRLRGEPLIEVRAHAGEGIDLLAMWEHADAVLLVDTVRSGAPTGTIHRYDVSDKPLPSTLQRQAGHAVSVHEAIELARALDRLPAKVVVFGVEGERLALGSPRSSAVESAVDTVAEAVRSESRALLRSALGR